MMGWMAPLRHLGAKVLGGRNHQRTQSFAGDETNDQRMDECLVTGWDASNFFGGRIKAPLGVFRTIQMPLSTYRAGSVIVPILDAVRNGRRYDDVTLLGMWWSATVMVLRL